MLRLYLIPGMLATTITWKCIAMAANWWQMMTYISIQIVQLQIQFPTIDYHVITLRLWLTVFRSLHISMVWCYASSFHLYGCLTQCTSAPFTLSAWIGGCAITTTPTVLTWAKFSQINVSSVERLNGDTRESITCNIPWHTFIGLTCSRAQSFASKIVEFQFGFRKLGGALRGRQTLRWILSTIPLYL